MLQRLAAAVAASLFPLTLMTVAAPSSQAVPTAQTAYSCNITVPSRVAISSPYRTITASFSPGCLSYAQSGWWDLMHPTQGYEGSFNFDGASTDTEDWYDWSPLGTYSVRPDYAYDHNYDDMLQNSRTMTVKIGSRTSISSSRSGNYVAVKGTATRYSLNYETYRAWAGQKVVLRAKNCSSCSWRWVASPIADRYGRVSVKAYASTARYWRLSTADTSTTFGRTSSTVKR
jgi:hypothetical protein